MRNKDKLQKRPNSQKSAHRKHIIAAGIIFCVIIGYIFWVITYNNYVDYKSQKQSEMIIRKIVAGQLNKDPNELTDEDFTEIKSVLYFREADLTDIKLLEKFTNLKILIIDNDIKVAANRIPTWKLIMCKLGIIDIDLENKIPIDLSPLANLSNLKMIGTINCRVVHLEKLKNLKKLETLWLCDSDVSDFKPLKELVNLQLLRLEGTQISDLKPLKDLKNLEKLFMDNTQISDLEPLNKLTSLKSIYIQNCKNITDEQVEDLQKELPKLSILK